MSLVAALVVTAPLLRPGTVLQQDMVFVPDQPWRAEWLGLSTALPRAVPADAVVAVLTSAVPGEVLQKAVLLLSMALAGAGAARLVPAAGALGRIAAALAYAWTPYFAERLLIGQWTLLVAYAALPWVVHGARSAEAGGRGAVARTLLVVAAASITATGGLLALAGLLVGAGWSRRLATLTAGWLVLQLPWIVPGALHPAGAASDPAGVAAFAARAENWSGTFGSLLSTGGIWNALAVPGSRTSPVAPLLTAAMLVLAALGLARLRSCWGPAAARRLVVGGLLALSTAALAVVPGTEQLITAAVEHVPGAGLLRDGQKWLPPWALLVAVAVGLGVERIAAVPARRAIAVLWLLLPLAALPDLAWGVGGRLAAVPWPDDWRTVAAVLQDDPRPGSVVSLPISAYRAYDWNDRRPSLDPTPRWLERDVVVDDRLRIDDVVLAGEDPRSERVRRALGRGTSLGAEGVGWALVHRGTPGQVPAAALAGAELVHDGPDLQLWRLPDVLGADDRLPPALPVLLADAAALAVVVSAGAAAGVAAAGRRRRGARAALQ